MSNGFRNCEFCGCHTNAQIRRCCQKAYEADHAKLLSVVEGARAAAKRHIERRRAAGVDLPDGGQSNG
jgi:hypothetical protein